MDATRRAELRELCERATPGEWKIETERTTSGEFAAVIVGNQHPSYPIHTPVCRLTRGFVWYEGDKAFIAAARTALPAALDALDAAEAQIAEMRKPCVWKDGWTTCGIKLRRPTWSRRCCQHCGHPVEVKD